VLDDGGSERDVCSRGDIEHTAGAASRQQCPGSAHRCKG
jgi:hypothetical protein